MTTVSVVEEIEVNLCLSLENLRIRELKFAVHDVPHMECMIDRKRGVVHSPES